MKMTVDFVMRQLQNTPHRPSTDHTWTHGEDHQGPEVYVAKAQADGIPALTPASGTGPGDLDKPGKGVIDIYQLLEDTVDVPELRQTTGLIKTAYNLTQTAIIEDDWLLAMRTKYGKWITFPLSLGLIGFILDEDHPSKGIPFDITLGIWNPSSLEWDYTGEAAKAIDWRHGVPYPLKCATGLGVWRAADDLSTGTSGTGEQDTRIMEVVALDCTSPGCAGT
jgi:hypothetical protein